MGASTLTAKRNKPGDRHLKKRRKISSRRQRKNETKKRRPATRNRKRKRPRRENQTRRSQKRKSPKKRKPRRKSRKTTQSRRRAMRAREVRCETSPSEFSRHAPDAVIVRRARSQCTNYFKHRLRDYARKNLYTCGPTNRRRHGCNS